MFDLVPKFDNCKSFYGKALVIRNDDGSITLYSYKTKVAKLTRDNRLILYPSWDYSATTLRHVKEFILQFDNKGNDKLTKKDVEKLGALK